MATPLSRMSSSEFSSASSSGSSSDSDRFSFLEAQDFQHQRAIFTQFDTPEIGGAIPDLTFPKYVKVDDGSYLVRQLFTTGKILTKDKNYVVVVATSPFTPTCSKTHLAGFEALVPDFKDAKIGLVVTSTGTPDVMVAWMEQYPQLNEYAEVIPDPFGDFTTALGIPLDFTPDRGLPASTRRATLYLTPGKGTHIIQAYDLENESKNCGITSAEKVLEKAKELFN